MQRVVQVPSALMTALNGLVVVFVVSSEYFKKKNQRKRMASMDSNPDDDSLQTLEKDDPVVQA
jgi:ABC-type uncharacterized transport system permease subunit